MYSLLAGQNVTHNSRHKVLAGTTIVLSGIVPLSADFMRYLLDPNLSRDWRGHLWCDHMKSINPNVIFTHRSEVVLQAGSFGADIQTKYGFWVFKFPLKLTWL